MNKKEKEDFKEELTKDEKIERKKESVNSTKNDNYNYYYYNRKKGNNKAVVVLLVIIAFLVFSFGAFFVGYSLNKSKNESNKDNIDIKRTETVTVKSDGVYITDVSAVVDEVMPSIVAITSKTVINSGNYGPIYGRGGSYTTVGAGSGVIIEENDDEIFILTNYHVVEDSSELSVKFIDDKSYDAKVKGVSENKDIAIVSVKKKDVENSTLEKIKVATIGSSNDLKVGNGIIAIGNALGYGQSVTTGVVSALNREIVSENNGQEMIQIDAAINGGNSGGALLNNKGEVVGINTAKYSSNAISTSASIEGMGFAIPISNVVDLFDELISGKNDDSGSLVLGIEGAMTNVNSGFPSGFYVIKIDEGGNADKSDLEIGNIITEVDGKEVTSVDTIKNALSKKSKGDKITLKVKYASKNDYKEKEIVVTLN